MMIEDDVHYCSACRNTLPVCEFYTLPNGKLDYRCKECKKHNRKSLKKVSHKEEEKVEKEILPDGWRRCKVCSQVKEIEEDYHKSKNNTYRIICKRCVSIQKSKDKYENRFLGNGKKIKRNTSEGIDSGNYKMTTRDWQSTYEMLKLMNYDTSQDIHQQFCERHNIPYNPKKRYISVKHPKKLGLI